MKRADPAARDLEHGSQIEIRQPMVSRPAITCVVFLVGFLGRAASAQPPLERLVRNDNNSNQPLIVTRVDAQTVGRLAAAARVPMGFVGWDAPKIQLPPIVASGRPLRQVLDDMIKADPRYRWDDDYGVIVVAATSSLEDATRLLDATTDGVMLENVDSNDAFQVIARLVGAQPSGSVVGDTKPFSVTLPPTRTIRDVLNAIVQSDGALAWSLTPSNNPQLPLFVTLFAGATGHGVGVPQDTVVRGRSPVHGTIEYGHEGRPEDVLDRTIARDGPVPLRWSCICESFVVQLARVTGVPMGLETASGRPRPINVPEIDLTGLRLRDVLVALTAAQPDYEWRQVDGIIVFRPRGAWESGDDPLFGLVEGVQLRDEPTQKVIGAVLSRFGVPNADKNNFPDARKITLDQPRGTALDLLNALAHAHGQLVWIWGDLESEERAVSGWRYRVRFSVIGGGGLGYSIP